MPFSLFHSWTTLKPGILHLIILSVLGLTASVQAIRACFTYNEIAGTDLTPGHIAKIAAGVFLGPMVGPIANPGATGDFDQAKRWTAFLFTILLIGASPFLIVRKSVGKIAALAAWLGFAAVTALWFFGALLSLGLFLS